METRADRLNPLPANLSRIAVSRRAWNGAYVDVTEYWGQGQSCTELCYENETRLIGMLEETGRAHCEPRLRADRPCPFDYTPRNLHLASPGTRLWGYCADMRYVKDATLVFRIDALENSFGARLDARALATPRIRFSDERAWTLLKLLADTVEDPDPSSQLFGDGNTVALLARLTGQAGDVPRTARGRLAPWQLRRVVAYLDEHLPGQVQLADLAALAGLSQAHFARAFKASTGRAPYRWQLEARVSKAKALLADTDLPLDDVAELTGFADATHFGRRFRMLAGISPAVWRRERKA